MEQKEKDKFSSDWRIKYLDALKHKHECLMQMIATNIDNHNIKRNYEVACFKIEYLELEHKIFWEQLVVNDWMERALMYDNKINQEYEDAKSNLVQTIKEAKRIINSNPQITLKLSEIVNKFDTIDFSEGEKEILVTYYQSLKHEINLCTQ